MPLNTKQNVDSPEKNSPPDGSATDAERIRATVPFTDDEADLQTVLDRLSESHADEAGQIHRSMVDLRQRVDELERRNDALRDVVAELFVAVKAILMAEGLEPDWNPATADVTIEEGAEEGQVDFEDLGDPYDPSKEFE